MKIVYQAFFCVFCIFFAAKVSAQHESKLKIRIDADEHLVHVEQQLTFYNQTDRSLSEIILSDWNNAYSAKNTPLAKRFSDEFVRSFHFAKDEEHGHTTLHSITSGDTILWHRPESQVDLIAVDLKTPILPGEKRIFTLQYTLKLPSAKFTGHGFHENGYHLRNWFLTPARIEDGEFLKNSHNNLDDISNGHFNVNLEIENPEAFIVTTDLDKVSSRIFEGKNRIDFALYLERKSDFLSYRNAFIDVENNLKPEKTDDIQRAIIVDRIVNFVREKLGDYPNRKIVVSQDDYNKNPFYGLNQLPSFLKVFPQDFIYELKFLRTYTNNFLKQSVALDARKDNWIYDAIQVNLMMDYIDTYHSQAKLTGNLSQFRLLKSYNITNLQFNGQYNYFYMLMARKNLDQPLSTPKDQLIKFNEQIASKYYAGITLKFLDSYLGDDIVEKSIREFYKTAKINDVSSADFASILRKNTDRDIDWYFRSMIATNDIMDYKFREVKKDNDSVRFKIKHRTDREIPVPVYGLKKNQVVFKEWITTVDPDSIYVIPRNDADKIVLNYKYELPEYNMRNNWRALKRFNFSHRPVKFVFFKDLEDPYYNQVLYVPTLSYNLYDGLTPGLRFYNKTMLDKRFIFDINPAYSTNTESLAGSASLSFNQNVRNSKLYHVRYAVGGSKSHYAPDAAYFKFTPIVQFRFRPHDLRDNKKQLLSLRQVVVHRDPTNYQIDGDTQDYSVTNLRYVDNRTELTQHYTFFADFQAATNFGKAAVEFQYRKLFENNRMLSLRFYGGSFLYNKTQSNYFSFSLDRPTDYLFDYNYYGRSESSGFFSQQLILAEGGFKSKLANPFANQWLTTVNTGFTVWNWIEVYGDAGFLKSRNQNEQFVYDSGIRLNLVTDYFEVYLPVYSNNGWEVSKNSYAERIRFIITLSPGTLLNLFTRKWF